MGCLVECWELGPPPDTILFLPPPPAPSFLQPSLPDLLSNTTPCSSSQLCESWTPVNNKIPYGGDFIELPRKDIENWSVSSIDDTWLLVLVASSIGVLLLGALLAMFLLKCREMNMFGTNDCSIHSRDHRPIKSEPRECTSANNINGTKMVHPTETVLYHGASNLPDNRMVWAALTPRGTQHFISENYPRDLVDFETEDHYETIDNIQPAMTHSYNTYSYHHHKGLGSKLSNDLVNFDNRGLIDYEYEDPTPLIEGYRMNEIDNKEIPHYTVLENTDMRCASLGMGNNTLRRGIPSSFTVRPRVSAPTRIEHPNLPPLNLYPLKSNTLRRDSTSYRNQDNGTLPKYGC